jgi:hypothetical protein
MIRKKFQRYGMREFQIIGAIDLAHSTLAEQPNDPITVSQNRAWHKTRIID